MPFDVPIVLGCFFAVFGMLLLFQSETVCVKSCLLNSGLYIVLT